MEEKDSSEYQKATNVCKANIHRMLLCKNLWTIRLWFKLDAAMQNIFTEKRHTFKMPLTGGKLGAAPNTRYSYIRITLIRFRNENKFHTDQF